MGFLGAAKAEFGPASSPGAARVAALSTAKYVRSLYPRTTNKKEKKLRKLMMLAAVLALVLAAAVPAVAQVVTNELGQETESGDVNVTFEVSSEGDYASQCVAPLQFGNTGNVQNAQGFAQYASDVDDVEFSGNEFAFGPSVSTECNQAVQQSAAASSR